MSNLYDGNSVSSWICGGLCDAGLLWAGLMVPHPKCKKGNSDEDKKPIHITWMLLLTYLNGKTTGGGVCAAIV